MQRTDDQWARAKGFDSSCPLGPWIETELEVDDLQVTTRLDGEVVQDGRTSQMVFDVPEIVAYVSSAFTLLPGDVILTGTPAGVGPDDPRPAGGGRDRGHRHAGQPRRASLTPPPGMAPAARAAALRWSAP